MSGSAFGTQSSKVAWALAVLAAYLLTRPYLGLYHDSLLYAAQALYRSGADALADDLFFKYGNQGAFVLFPALQGMLIEQLGLGPAMMIARGLSSLIWLAGLGYLSRTIYPERRQWLIAMGLAILMFAGYGNAALSYGEAFVTSRPFAEGFGMLALAFALRDRFWAGAIAAVLSLILHPLVGLSVFGLWLLLAIGLSLRLFVIVALGLAGLYFAGSEGIAPATWLFETHSEEWAGLLRRYESLGFVVNWGWTPLRIHALATVILFIAALSDDRLVATFARAVLLAGAVLLSVSMIGADLLGNRLIAALQPWRILSWVALSGHLLALHVLLKHPPRSAFFVILLAGLIANTVEHLLNFIPVFSSGLAVLVLLSFWSLRPGRGWRWINALFGVAATVMLAGLGSYIYLAEELTWIDKLARLGAALLVAIAFSLPGRWWATVFALIACGIAIHQFDRRDDKLAFVESGTALPADLEAELKGKTVYWESGLEYMWIALRQPQFYSCQQRAGTLFYPEQAIEHERRGQLLAPLNTGDFTDWPEGSCPAPQNWEARGPGDSGAIDSVCAALPELDVMILNAPIPGIAAQTWRLPVGDEGKEIYLVPCKS